MFHICLGDDPSRKTGNHLIELRTYLTTYSNESGICFLSVAWLAARGTNCIDVAVVVVVVAVVASSMKKSWFLYSMDYIETRIHMD